MGSLRSWVAAAGTLVMFSSGANAGVCDYRLSNFITGLGAGVAGGVGGAGAAAGVYLNVAGYYTLTNAVTGATMLASTAPGLSAAGTVGIIAGTGTGAGAAAGAAMSPAAIAAGVAVAIVVGGSETVCFFMDERITDYETIYKIMESMAATADPRYFRVVHDMQLGGYAIVVADPVSGENEHYLISNLYIVNGVLKHRDWGLNTVIGSVGYAYTAAESSSEAQ